MSGTRRVVVTGLGLVSSLGIGTEANWAALVAGDSVKVGYLSVADVPTVVDLSGIPDDRLGEVALEQLEPGDDIHATAEYRAQLVRVLTARVVRSAREGASK